MFSSSVSGAIHIVLYQASKNNHVLVVYEIALSVQKLVSKMYMELHFSSWDLVLDILNNLFEHTGKYVKYYDLCRIYKGMLVGKGHGDDKNVILQI